MISSDFFLSADGKEGRGKGGCEVLRRGNGNNVLSICRKTSRKVRLSVLEAREAKDGYVTL